MNSGSLIDARVSIGCCGFGQSRANYMKQLSGVELQEPFIAPPKAATLKRWQAAAPKDFAFAVRAWQVITHGAASPMFSRLPARWQTRAKQSLPFHPLDTALAAFAQTQRIADDLAATAIVFETPPTFTPTTSHRLQLTKFFEQLPRNQQRFVWEPRGLWTADDVATLCRDLDLIHAHDPLVDETEYKSAIAYFKLRSSHYTPDQLDLLADTVSQHTDVFVIFAAAQHYRAALSLQQRITPL